MSTAETRRQQRSLRQLARLHGLLPSYTDALGHRRTAKTDALIDLLRALGAAVETLSDAPAALREAGQGVWRHLVEPVSVVWGSGPLELALRLPAGPADSTARCSLTLENGEQRAWVQDLSALRPRSAVRVEGERFVVKTLPVPGPLTAGYHKLLLELPDSSSESLIIAAPRRAFLPPEGSLWGVFMPLYALHSRASWGAGDLADLEVLMSRVASEGGSAVATLPLLPVFLDTPFDPSPYAPVSRLLWNELYVHVPRIPEYQACPEAQAEVQSSGFQAAVGQLRAAAEVDYRRLMSLKRRVLEILSRELTRAAPERAAVFRRFLDHNPEVLDYAQFRAFGELRAAPWPDWPESQRNGRLQPADGDEPAVRYHAYAQWVAAEQIQSLGDGARAGRCGLYLDLPLGVHRLGYDVWRNRDAFILGASAGAPPDPYSIKGQDWQFPPLHPERMRARHYGYVVRYLRHHLRHAGILRIDHVMGLHRLFCIPEGLEARDGVYLRYPAEELYAILCLESHRHQAWIVGENLGTVPAYVDATMVGHGIQRMYVAQYELSPGAGRALPPPPADCVASLNTHDMPPFAAFWDDLDIEDRLGMGLLDAKGAAWQRRARRVMKQALGRFLDHKGLLRTSSRNTMAVMRGCLEYLAASSARLVLINLEDLWLETQPQNVPNTGTRRPNWRRKARLDLETMLERPSVTRILRRVHRLRLKGKPRS